MPVSGLKQRGISIPSESAGGSQPGWAPGTEIQTSHFRIGESGLAPNSFQIQMNLSRCIPTLSGEQIRLCVLGSSLGKPGFSQSIQNKGMCWNLCLWNTNPWSCTQNPPGDDTRKGIMDVTLRPGCNVHPWRDGPATTVISGFVVSVNNSFLQKNAVFDSKKSFGFGEET